MMTDVERQPVFTSRPREYLASLDRALGRDVRSILLRDTDIPVHTRVYAALDLMVAHVLATEKLHQAAECDAPALPDWAEE